MKTVTSGRDETNQPLWTPALRQFAAECGFHPEACAPAAGNQKGAVESLVKWVKGNFLAGRQFADDADLAAQCAAWQEQGNGRPSAATDVAPLERLGAERDAGGVAPLTLADYGVLLCGQVTRESIVHVLGNGYSVPVAHVGCPVTVRVHAERIVLWRDGEHLASHRRAPDGAHQRVIDPAHYAPLFPRKPRGQVMLYRTALLRPLTNQRRLRDRAVSPSQGAARQRGLGALPLAGAARRRAPHDRDGSGGGRRRVRRRIPHHAARTARGGSAHRRTAPARRCAAAGGHRPALEQLRGVGAGRAGGGAGMSLQALATQLQLPYLAAALDGWLDRAAREELSFADLLQGLFEEEAVGRAQADAQRRLRQAGFPFAASIEQFDFRFRPELKRQVILRYLDPSFLSQATTLAFIGPPGLGKTMLAIAIATKHVQH